MDDVITLPTVVVSNTPLKYGENDFAPIQTTDEPPLLQYAIIAAILYFVFKGK